MDAFSSTKSRDALGDSQGKGLVNLETSFRGYSPRDRNFADSLKVKDFAKNFEMNPFKNTIEKKEKGSRKRKQRDRKNEKSKRKDRRGKRRHHSSSSYDS